MNYQKIKRINNEDNQGYINLGLPSGTLWAKCNVGARSETEYGAYLNWEEGNSKYHLPSIEQFKELLNECQWKWCTIKEHSGYLIIGKNGNSIFLPTAGYRGNANINSIGFAGYYWCDSLDLNHTDRAYYMNFDCGEYCFFSSVGNYYYYKRSVRVVKILKLLDSPIFLSN